MDNYLFYKQILLILTLDCNLRCSYCFENNVHRKEYMSDETIEEIKQQIKKDGHFLCDNIEFFGGEPMLAQDKIISFIKEFKDELCYTIMTNGTILPSKEFIEVAQPYASSIAWFLSYDGPELNYQRKNGEKSLLRCYRRLEELGFDNISVISTYTKEFSERVVQNILSLAKYKFKRLRIKRLIHIAGYSSEYLKPIADSINKMVFVSIYVKHKYGICINLPDNIDYPMYKEGFARRSYLCDTFTVLCTGVGTDGKLYMCEPLAALQQGAYGESIKDWRKKPQYYTQLKYNKPYTICQTDGKSDSYYDKKTLEGQKLYEYIDTRLWRLQNYKMLKANS